MRRERRRGSLKNLVNYIIKIQHFEELKEIIGVLDLASLKARTKYLYRMNNSYYGNRKIISK